jgi:hypothetical protein
MFYLFIIEMSDIVEGIPDTVETLVLTSLPIDDLGLIEAYFPNLTRLIMTDDCCISQNKLTMSGLHLNHLEIKNLLHLSDRGIFGKRTWNGQDKMIKTSQPKVDKKIYTTKNHELEQYYNYFKDPRVRGSRYDCAYAAPFFF